VTLLATFKHISSKNADYGAAEAYLTFEHDEFTMKPTLDENGRLIPREDYRISSLNCGGEDFAVACMRANLRYEKNQKREDVKSHHYIISFDPRDGTDNGLTTDRAQELGEQFCKAHFPGHQALICTHPDGHNHSGNIHVHIVINSLRIYEVPLLPYMDRPADTREGCKHRCTNAAMEYFKSEVMEMCHREGLYQIDLLNGSKERITEREYWAAKKGQLALDKENAAREAAGQPTKPTKFETDKAKLRRTIRQALSQAASFDEFSSLLLREGVTVKESRGRLSYLTPDRTKPITARKLGDDFDKAAVLALLTQNAHRAAEQTKAIPEYPALKAGGKVIQYRCKVCHAHRDFLLHKGVGDTGGKVAFSCPHAAPKQVADIFSLHGFPALHIKAGGFGLWVSAIVMLKCPVPHSRVGKAPAFQVLHFFKVLLSAFGGLLLFTGCPLAVALCRVAVTPETSLSLCKIGFFGRMALTAV
jgi:hypothetical protein